MIADETWDRSLRSLGQDTEALIEIVASVGCWSMISVLLRGLDVELEHDVSSWPPDGVAPDSASSHRRAMNESSRTRRNG
jgi:hypothetical protein